MPDSGIELQWMPALAWLRLGSRTCTTMPHTNGVTSVRSKRRASGSRSKRLPLPDSDGLHSQAVLVDEVTP